MSDPRYSLEMRLLRQLDKVRLVMVGLFVLVLFTSPVETLTNHLMAATTVSFAALYVVITRFVLDWHSVRREGHMDLMAALLMTVDLVWITAFAWALGPEYRSLSVLLALPVLFAAAFFRAGEVVLVTAIAVGCHLLLQFGSGPAAPLYSALAGVGALIVVAWLAHALAETARQERATTDRIVSSLTEGVILVTLGGKLALINRRMEHMAGVEASQVLGRDIRNPEHAGALAPLEGLLQDCKGRPRHAAETQVRRMQMDWPTPLEVECLTSPCQTETGSICAWVVVCRDITELVSSVTAREESLREVSHELRGRVHTLRAVSEVLSRMADTLDEESRRQALEILDGQTDRLRRLIGRILDCTAVEKGNAVFQHLPVAIDVLAEQVCEGLRCTAQEQGIELDWEREGGEPTVLGDYARLDQVLQNLVENALQFTAPGGRVRITVREEGEEVEVCVRDTGCGIPQEEQEQIFEKFVHAQARMKSAVGAGLGLGLYMCREIVRRHGGSLEVESTPGVGSAFRVRLPAWSEERESVAGAEWGAG